LGQWAAGLFTSHKKARLPSQGGLFHSFNDQRSTIPAAVIAATAMAVVREDDAPGSAEDGDGCQGCHGKFGEFVEHGCLLMSGVMRPF